MYEAHRRVEGENVYQRKETFLKDHYYHIYNRGVDKSSVFFNSENYLYCLRLIKRYKARYGISVIAYCLMPNHYHLLLRQDGVIPLYRFINSLFNSYVQAVNRQQNRKGSLFEGRYQYVHVDREEYIIHLCRYIHLNPVNANLVSGPEEWPYSNYREWVNLRKGTLKDRDFIKAYFQSTKEYRDFCENTSDSIKKESQDLLQRYRID
jgi:putative transposase